MKSFNDLGRTAKAAGVLDRKTKELISLAFSASLRSAIPASGFTCRRWSSWG